MQEAKPTYHQQAYLWLSVALAMPILLWPGLLYLGFTPTFGVSISQNWVIAASILLIASVVADAILSYRNHASHVIINALWILICSYAISFAIRQPDSIWLIAALFAIRSLHAAYQLWHTPEDTLPWWLWTAWWRDNSTAFIMFFWLSFWP